MEQLSDFRSELDKLDEQLMATLEKRFAVCRQIASYKAQAKIPMMQPARVAQVKKVAASRALAAGLREEFAVQLYELIISEACQLEHRIIDQHLASDGSVSQVNSD
jgi:chorismate mutase-like protein